MHFPLRFRHYLAFLLLALLGLAVRFGTAGGEGAASPGPLAPLASTR